MSKAQHSTSIAPVNTATDSNESLLMRARVLMGAHGCIFLSFSEFYSKKSPVYRGEPGFKPLLVSKGVEGRRYYILLPPSLWLWDLPKEQIAWNDLNKGKGDHFPDFFAIADGENHVLAIVIRDPSPKISKPPKEGLAEGVSEEAESLRVQALRAQLKGEYDRLDSLTQVSEKIESLLYAIAFLDKAVGEMGLSLPPELELYQKQMQAQVEQLLSDIVVQVVQS